MTSPGDTRGDALTRVEVRTLLGVVVDLAEDFGFDVAAAVVDGSGALCAAERPALLPARHLDGALDLARAVLREGGDEAGGLCVGAVALGRDGRARGALAVAGGPDGFALDACREAARSLGLRAAA